MMHVSLFAGDNIHSLTKQKFNLVCHPVCESNFAWMISPEPLNHFKPNLVWWCIIMKQSVIQKNWLTVTKVTVRSCIIKMWLFLLYLVNGWSVYNQTWFDSIASYAGVSCKQNGLLHSRSRSQQRFEMLVCAIVSAQYLLKRSTIF